MQFDRRRLTIYPRLFLAVYIALAGWWIAGGRGWLDRNGIPVGADFVTFYAASALAGSGDAPGVWDPARLNGVEREVIGADIPTFVFHYPPTFLLALAPLALMPYVWALVTWWAASIAALLVVVRRIAPHPATTGLVLAFPGLFQNVVQGQNGAFTASLLGAGLLLVDRQPAWAGVAFGLLSFKPQLMPLAWLALAAGRRWAALAAAVTTAVALAALSVACFGLESWQAFAGHMPLTWRVLETKDALPWFRMPTVQVAAMMLGAPVLIARVIQGVVALGVVTIVALVWARGASLTTRAAALACGTILMTPFAFDYDLAMLAIPVAFLAWADVRHGVRRGDAALLALAWLTPLMAPALARATHVSLAPLVLIAIVVAALARERSLYNSSSTLQTPRA